MRARAHGERPARGIHGLPPALVLGLLLPRRWLLLLMLLCLKGRKCIALLDAVPLLIVAETIVAAVVVDKVVVGAVFIVRPRVGPALALDALAFVTRHGIIVAAVIVSLALDLRRRRLLLLLLQQTCPGLTPRAQEGPRRGCATAPNGARCRLTRAKGVLLSAETIGHLSFCLVGCRLF